eukprot:CAMPEP_0119548712 /NCGR_PEP_ID=MMETSP1352-20130426/2569_1 /TAXON_ID=265584 /ORGANISM="Stauroneis constricta, Strain CCMP1120" /LENGTH=55 /DNA_ID=CAMNT_0007594053 /DNA_START=265 /DNA_END=432 /DNA_ORIENTATION=-
MDQWVEELFFTDRIGVAGDRLRGISKQGNLFPIGSLLPNQDWKKYLVLVDAVDVR